MQDELRARGIPELSEKLKKEIGYDPVARKLRRNPREAEDVTSQPDDQSQRG